MELVVGGKALTQPTIDGLKTQLTAATIGKNDADKKAKTTEIASQIKQWLKSN